MTKKTEADKIVDRWRTPRPKTVQFDVTVCRTEVRRYRQSGYVAVEAESEEGARLKAERLLEADSSEIEWGEAELQEEETEDEEVLDAEPIDED
jgi:hypothetical protein